jgi:hypothetical protein
MTKRGLTPCKLVKFGPVKPTRFPELRYQHRGDHWRILDTDGDGIGPIYRSQLELLADLDRFHRSHASSQYGDDS